MTDKPHVTMSPDELAIELFTTSQCMSGGRSEAERLLKQIKARAAAPAGLAPATDRAALKRAHVALAEQAGRDQATLARIRQMVDYWEQNLPEVIRTPAVVSAIRAALERAAVLPAPTDQAAVRTQAFTEAADFFRGLHATGTAITAAEAEAELRRLAGEAQQDGPLRAELKPWQLLVDQPDEALPQTERIVGGHRLPREAQQDRPPVDRAAVYAEVAARLAADAEQGDKDGLTRIYRRSAARQVREWADEARTAREAQQDPTQDGTFIPPAALGLPAGTLEAAEIGANQLDAWARTPNGRNFLAHALVQLARTGWLRTEPDDGFEPMPDPAAVARPGQPDTDDTAQQPKEAENPRTVCVCGHTRAEHATVSGRLLCDVCDPDSTDNLVCKEFEAL